jgi:hypothetical protein
MWNDPIVEEIRKYRKEHAEKFGFDLDRIFEDFKRAEETRQKSTVLKEKETKYRYPQIK